MTHTLHRRGTAESLSEDFVVLIIPAMGVNDSGHEAKLKDFLKLVLKHNPVNIGHVDQGGLDPSQWESVMANPSKLAHAVFDNQAAVTGVLKELKEADLGLSVVVSGIFEKADECLEKAGLQHHTANFSLETWGKTEKLPGQDILEVTTMCGHAMIATDLVYAMADEVKAGSKTPEQAARVLAPQCACGIFNPARAAKLLAAMAQN
jgi:hypothetical protein